MSTLNSIPMSKYELLKTYTFQLYNIGFDSLPKTALQSIFKDGRAFSHLIEPWIADKFNLIHEKGCKNFDFKDKSNPEILIDEKTFTRRGLSFTPSNMKGQGRTFDKEVFEKKTKSLVFCCVSNINFPEIKVKFITGYDLLTKYPKGKIPLKDFSEFFN